MKIEQPTETAGAYTINQVMKNDCLRYKRKEGDGAEAVSIYPLNPHMFLPRPGVTDQKLPKRIVHRAYWVSDEWEQASMCVG